MFDFVASILLTLVLGGSVLSGRAVHRALPNTIVVGGSPVKAAGAGITVNVVAVGY